MVQVETTIKVVIDNTTKVITQQEAIELYRQLGAALNYPSYNITYTTPSTYTYPSGTVLCGTTVK